MAKIIQFPNTEVTDKAKQAMQEEIKMKRVEQSLNTMMLSKLQKNCFSFRRHKNEPSLQGHSSFSQVTIFQQKAQKL